MMIVRGVAAASGVAVGRVWVHVVELPPYHYGAIFRKP